MGNTACLPCATVYVRTLRLFSSEAEDTASNHTEGITYGRQLALLCFILLAARMHRARPRALLDLREITSCMKLVFRIADARALLSGSSW